MPLISFYVSAALVWVKDFRKFLKHPSSSYNVFLSILSWCSQILLQFFENPIVLAVWKLLHKINLWSNFQKWPTLWHSNDTRKIFNFWKSIHHNQCKFCTILQRVQHSRCRHRVDLMFIISQMNQYNMVAVLTVDLWWRYLTWIVNQYDGISSKNH